MPVLPAVLFALQAGAAPDLGWMAGDWVSCTPREIVEERWLGPAGGGLVGVNLTRTPDGRSFEFLRVDQGAKGLAYLASPGGRSPPTEFPLAEARPGYARFENPAHDFPKRIVYRREGAELHAEVSGDGPTLSWRMTAGEASACPALKPAAG
jgi:hypothetical protein